MSDLPTNLLTIGFDDPYLGGVASSTSLVPGAFDVAIGGHPYMVDFNHDITGFRALYFRRESIQALRQQSDTAQRPGEYSLNPDGAWRRSQETWHHGQGQAFLDRDTTDSDPLRFRTSKGVDPWKPWQLSLLPETRNQRNVASNAQCVVASGFLYVLDGNGLYFTTTIPSNNPGSFVWTTVTGAPGPNGNSITTDGYNVWVAWGPTAIYVTTIGAATMTSYVSVGLPVAAMAFVKGRLMVAVGASLYNITAAGALPTALYTQPNPGFVWTAFAEGPGFIYCLGNAGGISSIYSTQVQPDGTALLVPKIAGSVPAGETIYAARGYEGFLAVGTNRGLHIGSLDSSGNVTMGALIPTTSPVQAFNALDRFIYYGLTNYDGVSTGIGRADLSVFVAELAPASASDLMATAQGNINSIATYYGGLVFCVAGTGVFVQCPTALVSSGTLSTGSITFGLDDPKVALAMDVRHQPLHGTVTASLSVEGSAPVLLGISATQGSSEPLTTFAANQVSGVLMEMVVTLAPDGTGMLGPTLNRVRLRASPSPDRTMLYTVPLMFADGIDPSGHGDVHFDPLTEFDYLTALEVSGQLTTFQMLGVSHTVKIEDSNFVIYRRSDSGFWSGTYTVQLKEYL
jgi:hypothetical protein